MKREFFTAGALGMIGLLAAAGLVRGEDLVTLSGTTYRDVRAVRVEPDGVTWRYEGGAVKVDFADCPENVRRAYHFDPAKATAYRDARTRARQQADARAQRDAREHDARQHDRAQAALAQMTTGNGEAANVFRRALSPASSNATRALAAQMQADVDKQVAAANAGAIGQLPPVPTLPGALGPRPVNPTMDTPSSTEFRAGLFHAPSTGSVSNFVPTTDFWDEARSSLNSGFFTPIYMTHSYYEEVDRAAAFARGVPQKP